MLCSLDKSKLKSYSRPSIPQLMGLAVAKNYNLELLLNIIFKHVAAEYLFCIKYIIYILNKYTSISEVFTLLCLMFIFGLILYINIYIYLIHTLYTWRLGLGIRYTYVLISMTCFRLNFDMILFKKRFSTYFIIEGTLSHPIHDGQKSN